MSHRVVELGIHPTLANKTGRGVTIAVIDSGVHARHPHVQGVAGGITLTADGREHDEFVDHLGHGTAVTAAIKEKAPDAEIYAVKVFEQTLTTNAQVLAGAIDWASRQGARLINLSLGTANRQHEDLLDRAVDEATTRGSLIVSAYAGDGTEWLPGSLSRVARVILDWECPRTAVRVEQDEQGRYLFGASGYPRPIPGVDPTRNLHGISFAVANVTGCLARLLEGHPDARTSQVMGHLLSA